MKKIISALLVVIMLFSMIVPANAQDAACVCVSSVETTKVGEVITLTVSFSGLTEKYTGAAVIFEYDESKYEYQEDEYEWSASTTFDGYDAETNVASCMFKKAQDFNGITLSVNFKALAMTDATNDKFTVKTTLKNGTTLQTDLVAETIAVPVEGNKFTDTEKATVGLTINGAALDADKTVDYDPAKKYTIAVTSAIEGATVKVKCGEKIEDSFEISMPGTYTYTAVVTKPGYNDYETEAKTVTIKAADMTGCAITVDGTAITADTAVDYNGAAHVIEVKKPEGATAVVTVNGEAATNASVTNVVDEVEIKAVITQEGFNPVTVGPYKVTVKPALLTVSEVKAEKQYDGNVTALDAPVLNGVIGTDDVTLAGFETSVNHKDVTDAAGKKFTLGNLTLAGAAAGNYTLNGVTTYTATVKISPAPLTVKAKDLTVMLETIDENYAPVFDFEVVSGLQGTDTKAVVKGALDCVWEAKLGNYDITKGTLNADNYTITFEKGIFSIIERVYTKIEIVEPATKPLYIEGTSFDMASLKVNGTYKDANGVEQVEEGIANSLLEVSPAKFETVGNDQVVTVSLKANKEVKDTLTVDVRAAQIDSIEAAGKAEYLEGDAFDANVIKVKAVMDNGTEVAEYTNFTYAVDKTYLDSNNKLIPGTYTVTVTAQDKTYGTDGVNPTDTYTFVVKAKQVVSIAVTGNTKTEYVEGQTFDKTGIVVTATYNNGDTEDVTAKATYTPSGALTAGTINVVYSYTHTANGETKTVTDDSIVLTVAKKAVAKIEVVTQPADKEYVEATAFDPTGMVVKVTYNDEAVATHEFKADAASPEGFTFDPAVLTEVGENQTVTVSYGGKTASITGIKVVAKTLDHIVVEYTQKEYVDGDSFIANVVRAYYDNNTSEVVTGYTVSPEPLKLTDPDKAEEIKVTVTYKDKTAKATVTVKPCIATVTTGSEPAVRYATIEDAILNAAEGSTVKLEKDAKFEYDVPVEVSFTLDLNGKNVDMNGCTIKSEEDIAITVIAANNTVENVITFNGEDFAIPAGETVIVEDSGFSDEFIMIEMAKFHMDHFMFNLDVEKTENGSIKLGKTYVRINDTVIATITPDAGYEIADVLVDGESVGAVSKYTFAKVKADHVITAVFTKIETEAEAE